MAELADADICIATPLRQTPRRVLFVHYGEAWLRGSERVLLDTMIHLDKTRFTPVLWCNAGALAESARDSGIAVTQGEFEFYFHPDSPRFSWQTYRKLVTEARALIETHNADLVHVNSAAPTQFMLPAARLAGIPILAHLHTPTLRRSRYVFGLHLVDLLIGVSHTVLADFQSDGISPNRLALIPNGVDPVRLLAGNRSGLREAHSIAESDVVIALVGSLIHRKGHDILLEALRRMGGVGPNMHVLFVGDGLWRAHLVELAHGLPVHFLGDCADVGAILRDAVDLLVVPSRQEAFGLVIAEAGFFGIPAIGTRTGGIPEVIRAGETGLLTPVDDPDGLAAALSQLVSDAPLRRRMGNAARQHVAANFTIERTVRRIERSYQNTMECHRRSWFPGDGARPYWRLARMLATGRLDDAHQKIAKV